jgi:hypothetical protein
MNIILNEAIRQKDFARVGNLIQQYLRKKLGKVYLFPTPENFIPAGGSQMTGVRYFLLGNKSIRLNWRKQINSSQGLVSMDYWDGSKMPQPYPSHHIQFDVEQSLVNVLPFIVDFLNGKAPNRGYYVTEDIEAAVNFNLDFRQAVLAEALVTTGDITKTIANILNDLKRNIQIADQYKMGGNKKYGPRWDKAANEMKKQYASLFKKQGAKVVIDPDDVDKIDANKILSAIAGDPATVAYTITSGTKEEKVVEGTSDADVDRMSYEEQLDSLKSGMKLLMANATNAMFVGGRGGTGKTQTVEDMLHAAGKRDGEGYFKITGSATPTGIYRILYTHRKEIILFDDSDSALNDQEGRNLFKAAADTKKVRKISWMKGGKNFVDPADFDEDAEDDTLPRYFEFTGKIIFISNMPLNKLDPDGALRTRGYVMNVDPTNEEIYDFMAKIATKIPLNVDYPLGEKERLEVVEVLRSRKVESKSANLRQLVRAMETRAGIEMFGGTREEWVKFAKMYA